MEQQPVPAPGVAVRTATEAPSLASLHLPPTFIADHCLRALYYQGAMSPADVARHWRVHVDIATEVVESLKSAALVEPESGQAAFERLAKVRLTAGGQAQAASARSRTWYSGPLPVSVDAFEREARSARPALATGESLRAAFAAFYADEAQTAELAQAIIGGATVALGGVAYDEQADMAAALGAALHGQVRLPYAIYAAGAVVRMFDPRVHRTAAREQGEHDGMDILRSHDGPPSQWAQPSRPVVCLAGGVQPSDVIPAYDAEAKFYLAPRPLAAHGGLLAVFDAGCNEAALAELARLWLIPGRHGSGLMLLRSGERIELPWHAATVLFGWSIDGQPAVLRDAVIYTIDMTEVRGSALRNLIGRRLADPATFPDVAIDAVATMLERSGAANRSAAARASRYLLDRARYEGASFTPTTRVLEDAVHFAGGHPEQPGRLQSVA
jgi:hypothetical protein